MSKDPSIINPQKPGADAAPAGRLARPARPRRPVTFTVTLEPSTLPGAEERFSAAFRLLLADQTLPAHSNAKAIPRQPGRGRKEP